MIYTLLTKKAIKLMFNAHKEQKDKSGLPYVFHPFHVAESMDDEYSTVVALLHDVVEDTEVTHQNLIDEFNSSLKHEEIAYKIVKYKTYLKII